MNDLTKMKKQLLAFIIGLLLLFVFSDSKSVTLSDKAEISILTCSPGNEMYSVYGHSGIRVVDISYNTDIVFNYGLFDFDTPNFLYRFASGQTDYLLGVNSFEGFIAEYKRDKRNVFEQVLNLSQKEKQKLFDFLVWNAKPENRVYRYNFFFDNCATRIRDVLQDNVNGQLIFPEPKNESKTFRRLVKDYHGKLIWVDFGIDLVVAAPSDKLANAFDEMFLPDYLMYYIEGATIKGNKEIPLVKSSHFVFKAPVQEYKESQITGPFVVFLIITILIFLASFLEYRNKKMVNWLDYLVYGINGLMGVIIFWFVLYSEHPAMNPNYNLMWAIPLNFVFVFLWKVKKWRPFTKYYHIVISIWLILFLLVGTFLPQQFNVSFYLFVFMILSRSVFHSLLIFKQN